MSYKLRPGQTAVQGNADLILDPTSKVLELRHILCGNRKICAKTDELTAHLTLTKGDPVKLVDGTYRTKVHVSGKLLYQPVSGCGGGSPYPYNGYGCSPCEPCPQEDVIFSSFNIYSTESALFLVACDATATAIVHSDCQDFTNEVLTELPYNIYFSSKAQSEPAAVTSKSTK